MSEREDFWYSDSSETLAYNLPDRPSMKDAHAERIIKSFTEAKKDYSHWREDLDNSIKLSRQFLEDALALMNMYDGNQVEIFFEEDKPIFVEQQMNASSEPLVRAMIAPRLDPETVEELRSDTHE